MAGPASSNAKTHFHLGLLAAFAPGFGALFTVALAVVHRRSDGPWGRRLALLAGSDVLVVLALAGLAASGGLERLKATTARPSMIGVQVEPQEPRVVAVTPGSPAAEAGMKAGDRLLRIDGHEVKRTEEAVVRLRRLPAGRPARVTVGREEGTLDLTVVPRADPRPVRPPADAGLERPSIGWTDLLPFVLAGALAALTMRRGRPVPPAWPAFFLIYIGTLAASAGTLWALTRLQGGLSTAAALVALGVQSLAFAGGTLVAQRARPFTPPAPEDPLPTGRAILLGAYYLITLLPRAAVLVAVLLALPLEGIPRPQDPVGALAAGGLSATAMALLALDVVVLAPVAEEMLFRGFLLPRLAARLHPTSALAATAVLFAALHTHYGVQALVLVVHGVVLGWARLRTGRLTAPIALHMMVNAVALAAGVLN